MDALHERPVRLGHAAADLPDRTVTEVRLHGEGVAGDLVVALVGRVARGAREAELLVGERDHADGAARARRHL